MEDFEYQLLPNNIRLNEAEFLSFLKYRYRQQLATHRALAIGSPAPLLPAGLRSLAGDTVQLARSAGNLVYGLLWDTRLPASQREIAPLKRLVAQFAGQPIRFAALALDEEAAAWQRLVATAPPVPGVQVLLPPVASAAAHGVRPHRAARRRAAGRRWHHSAVPRPATQPPAVARRHQSCFWAGGGLPGCAAPIAGLRGKDGATAWLPPGRGSGPRAGR